MKAKIWGIAAIVISIALWTVFAWIWLVVVGPNSSIWDCQLDGYAWSVVGPDGLLDYKYGVDLDVSGSIVYIIVVFFVPMSIISLISSVFLIIARKKKSASWGIVALISSFGMMPLYMIVTPSLPLAACAEATFADMSTFHCFMLLSTTSLISSIVLIRRNRKNVIDQ